MSILTILGALFVGATAGFVLAALMAQWKVTDMEIELENARGERDRYRSTLEAIANRMGVCALADVEAAARTALEDTK